MEHVKYTCDGPECKKETISLFEQWLTIGSKGKNLAIYNHLPGRGMVLMENYGDIHFCSKKCFTHFFFKPELIEA